MISKLTTNQKAEVWINLDQIGALVDGDNQIFEIIRRKKPDDVTVLDKTNEVSRH